MSTIKRWAVGAMRSLTMWVNSLAGLLVVYLPELKETLPELAEFLGPEAYRWLALVVILSNLVLRVKTKQSLAEKGCPPT